MRLHEINSDYDTSKILNEFFSYTGVVSYTDGLVNITGDCNLTKHTSRLPIKFGKVDGIFRCDGTQLKSLKGSPREVGAFECDNNLLTTLEGGPEIVHSRYYCHGNNLTSLIGAPKKVPDTFNCGDNQLITLISGPTFVGFNYGCSGYRNNLLSLDGIANAIGNTFIFHWTPNVPLLKLMFINRLTEVVTSDKRGNMCVDIINKYLGQGKQGALQCAAELSKAGFKGNARL